MFSLCLQSVLNANVLTHGQINSVQPTWGQNSLTQIVIKKKHFFSLGSLVDPSVQPKPMTVKTVIDPNYTGQAQEKQTLDQAFPKSVKKKTTTTFPLSWSNSVFE